MGVTREAPTRGRRASAFCLFYYYSSCDCSSSGNRWNRMLMVMCAVIYIQRTQSNVWLPVVACCVCCTFPLIAPQELIRILFAKPHGADFTYLGSRQWHKIHHKRTSCISALNSDISSITEPWLKIQPAVDVHRSKGQRFLMLQSI